MEPFKTLLSFAIYRKADIADVVSELGDGALVMADSGAYTARTMGITINVDEYAAWLHEWRRFFTVYPNLDVLHDVPASIKNQLRLESFDLKPLPVFHTGEPFRVLQRYCERHTYVALGGMVGAQGEVEGWVAECFKIAERTGTKFHGFGQTKARMLQRFPWFSVDSSSWAAGHWYGQVQVFDKTQLGRCAVGDAASVRPYAATLKRYGLDPAQISNRDLYDATHAIRAAACAWYDMEQYVRKLHGPIAPPEGYDLPHGLHVHLVSGQPRDLPRAREAVRAYLTGTPYVPPVTGMTLKERKELGR